MAAVGVDDQAMLQQALETDAYAVAETAEWIARKISAEPTEAIVEVYDNYWRPVWEITDEIDLTANNPSNKTPAGTINLKGSDKVVPLVRRCRETLVPITITTGAEVWAGFVDSTNYKLQQDGQRICVVNVLGIYDILFYIFILPVWWLPLAVQPISHAVFFGNICTVIEQMISEQAMRIQLGLWEAVNNILSLSLDMRNWFATWNINNGNLRQMLTTPIYVVRTNPFRDGSPFVAKTFRMTSLGSAIEELTKAYGVDVDMKLWLPGMPQPDRFANLKVPTYVVRVRDRSGITGPTGTFLDGIFRQVVDLAGSSMGKLLAPVIRQARGMDGVFIAPRFGVDFKEPWAVLIDPGPGKKGAMETFSIDDHHPKGATITIGGKSPAWVNSLINVTLSWIIDSITILAGITGIPSNLLEGFLNNSFLAFQAMPDYDQRRAVGPYGRPESFHPTQAAPYNVDAIFSFITARHDGRGYRSAQATFRNGYPFSYGRDFTKKSLLSIASEGEITTDYVEDVILTRNRAEGLKIMVQIGDGKAEEAPIVKHQRNIGALFEIANVLTLAPPQSS